MPVPLPGDADVLRTPPDEAEASRVVARGIMSAVTPDGGLTPLQHTLLGAIYRSMMGFEIDTFAVEAELAEHPYGPNDFAADLASRDAQFRGRMVQTMVIGELVLNPLPADVSRRVGEFAAELGVRDDLEDVLRGYAESGRQLAAIDFDRNGYLHDFDLSQAE
jgi:hypothetical protein